MLKTPITILITSLTAFSAKAQSEVNLYGIVDAGYAHIDNVSAGASNQLRSGNLYSSRWGVRSSEDLGGGMKARFQLEAGINADTGISATPFFNRQSWLGLSSATWGEIHLGRMLPMVSDIFAASLQSTHIGPAAAAFDGSGVGPGSSIARFNNMLGGTRVDNALKYQTPDFSGFKGHAMAALGEVASAAYAGRVLSVGGDYSSALVDAGLAFYERQCREVDGCAATQAKDKIIAMGAAYKRKGARYAFIYTRQKNALNVSGNDADVLSLLARIPFGAWAVSGGFHFLDDKTPLNQDARQLNIGLNYLLSRRTQIYGLYSRQAVANGGKAGIFSTTSSNDKQNQFALGISHRF